MSADFINFVSVAQGAAGTTLLLSGVSGKRHKVVGVVLTLSADGTVKFTGTSDLTGAMDIVAKGGFVLPTNNLPYIQAASGADLSIVTTGGAAKGMVAVRTEP